MGARERSRAAGAGPWRAQETVAAMLAEGWGGHAEHLLHARADMPTHISEKAM